MGTINRIAWLAVVVALFGAIALHAQTVNLSTSTLSFATLGAVSTVTAQQVTLTNTGSGALAISSIGTSSGDFAQANNCATSVAAGASCLINVSFTPTTGGLRTGSLLINDNASGSPQSVSLAG